jgi:hypothetical protein
VSHPNLFLVGAPKCGTSALHGFLAQHPDVWMSEPKEPHFFCPDVDAPFAIRDPERYEELFAGAHTSVVGESSATYLISKVAAQRIRDRYPDARIIAIVRNPLEMLPSLHAQKRVNGTEPYATFAEAWAAEARRKAGLEPALGAFPFYEDAARYSEQLERFFAAFPREQVHVIVFDDFKRDLTGVWERLLAFLELAPFTPNFKVVNRNKRIRSRALHNLLQNPDSALHRLPKPLSRVLYKGLDRLNSAHERRAPLAPELQQELRVRFQPEVARLSALLNRDLSPWLA